jgi:hypothetical protein
MRRRLGTFFLIVAWFVVEAIKQARTEPEIEREIEPETDFDPTESLT